MAYSYVFYTGDGSNRDFTFSFEYLDPSHIQVLVDGNIVGFTFLNQSTVRLTTAPSNGAKVQIKRDTPKNQPIVDFADGSVLREADLDLLTKYNLYVGQEAVDQAQQAISQDGAGDWDAVNRRIRNVANPVSAQDAVTRNWAETAMSSQLSQATTQANAAASSATSAANSASSASSSASTATSQATAASSSATAAAGSASTAQGSATSASNSATAAATSASQAATSATNAANSATTATNQANAASTSASNASQSATNAASSASNAAGSASAASGSATSASNSASAASTSASQAASSATSASGSATLAQDWAIKTGSAVSGGEFSAKHHAQQAATSASSASSSATSASTSATNAANSATSASNSASTATTQASQASTSATNAANSASAASTSASNAATSATNAANSASAASSSATAASGSATSAGNSATLAQDWAIKTGSAVSGGEFSAKHHAQAAATSATDASNSASSASTSASNASTSATNAANSATSASNSASAASTSASNAASSASSASTSASNAATSATNAANSATAAANSAAGVNLPAISAANFWQLLQVNAAGTGYQTTNRTVQRPVAAVSSNLNLSNANTSFTVACTNSAAISITLPAVSGIWNGHLLQFKRTNGPVTILAPSGDNIEGRTAILLQNVGDTVELSYGGSNTWRITGFHAGPSIAFNAQSGGLEAVLPTRSFRNKVINGDMIVHQRGTASVVVNGSGSVQVAYPVDRHQLVMEAGAGQLTGSRDTSVVVPGDVASLKVQTTTARTATAAEYAAIVVRLEGATVADLEWGTANAKNVNLSFWVRSSITGTYVASIRNAAGNRSLPITFSVISANTWEKKSVTFTGDTTGTWLKDSGTGIDIWFTLMAGSNFVGTANVWQGANVLSVSGAVQLAGTLNATFNLAQIQLEEGATPTPFERRPFTVELDLCRRYFERGYLGVFNGNVTSGSTYYSHVSYQTPKRATPTLSAIDLANNGFAAVAPEVAANGLEQSFLAYKNANGTISGGFFTFEWSANAEI